MKLKNHPIPYRWAPLFAAFLLLAATASFAQQPTGKSVQRNTFFLELGGNAMYYSLNYDRILLSRDKWKLSGRVGAMYQPLFQVSNRQMVGVPLEISYLRGRNKHFLEIGLGVTATYDTYPLSDMRIRDLAMMGVARVGYRHQKPEGGLFYKVGFTPMAGLVYDLRYRNRGTNLNSAFAYPLVGLAVGYTIRK
jgi:hypothetical protein